MIYLIVGQPRSGKSQYAVKIAFDLHADNQKIQDKIDKGQELKDNEKMALSDGSIVPAIRPIYSDIDEHAQRNDFIKPAPADWRDVEDGSVIFYDEVHFRDEYLDQNKYMSQNPMIKELSTHGHRNIDIYLMTQDPRRLEKSIRALVFKMFLVKRPANLPPFANIYTFDRWLGDPWAASKNPDNVHDTWKFIFKKKYYEAYKSASAHTSVKFQVQNKFIWAIIAIICMMSLAYYLIKISGMGKLVTDAANVSKIKEDTAVNADDFLENNKIKGLDERTEEERRADFERELEYNRNMIVKYDITNPYEFDSTQYQYQVNHVPVLSGCAIMNNTCSCYTQQMTKIEISQTDCKRYMSGDKPFNPFLQVNNSQQPKNDTYTEQQYSQNMLLNDFTNQSQF